MDIVQSCKIDIRFIHQVYCSGHRNHDIQYVAIMVFAICNMDKHRDAPPQVQERMDFYGPREYLPSAQRKRLMLKDIVVESRANMSLSISIFGIGLFE